MKISHIKMESLDLFSKEIKNLYIAFLIHSICTIYNITEKYISLKKI